MHNKFCVIDDSILINGSYNWTYYAENKNRENILLIKDEPETIKAFIQEFERIKTLTEKIDKIRQLTTFEIDEFNSLSARQYLANDIIFQAKDTGKKELVNQAFQIDPDNVEIQKIAFELDLTKKYKLKHSIGSSLQYDRYLIIIPKGTFLPVTKTEIVQTAVDNQSSSSSTIHYGQNSVASKNVKFAEMILYGLPKKLAGEAKMKYHFTIDLYGNLRMKKISLDNGVKQIVNKKITGIIEEDDGRTD